jgi:acetyl esterase/lipase
MMDIEGMLMRETDKVRARIDLPTARARIGAITTPIFVQGRNADELQGVFKVSYDLLREAGKETQWKTYEHEQHGFVYVKRDKNGEYKPNAVQREAVADSLAWFDRYMKSAAPRMTGSSVEYEQPFYND